MDPRPSLLAASLLFAAALPALKAHADAPSAVLEMDAYGQVQIAPDGHVSDYRLQNTLTPEVAALVDRNVRAWHFQPILVDGVPVVAKTVMHLHLNAEPQPGRDSYLVHVAALDFGQPQRNRIGTPPRYPDEAAHAGLGARVLLVVKLDDTGRVVDAQPFQTSLDARTRSEFQAEQWRKLFERTSIAAAKTWSYDLTEIVGGKKTRTTAIVPIVYSMNGNTAPKNETWKAYVPGPVHPTKDANRVADEHELSSLADGQALATDSRFRLTDDVIGKTL